MKPTYCKISSQWHSYVKRINEVLIIITQLLQRQHGASQYEPSR